MKKIRTYITLALVLAGILLAVSGCTNPIMPRPAPQKAENAGDGAGIALIQFGGGGRTVLPYAADFYYVLDFTPGAQTVGEARTESVSRSSSKSVELEVGDWSLAVKGYIDADHAAAAPAEPGLTGSADFTVAAGTEVSVPVPLTAFQTYEGAGEFAYTVSFPAGVLSAELSLVNILSPWVGDQGPINLLTGASESEGVKTKTGSVTGVPAGFYRLVLDLSTTIAGDAAKALKTRVVRIQDSLLTKTQETFGPGDFYVGVLFDNLDDLKNYLDSRDINTLTTPYQVALSSNFDLASTALKEGTDNLGKLYAALTRYVELDLSACTGASTGATGSGSTSGRTNQDKLVTVTLPPQITTISNYAFTGCTNLRSVNLPEGLTSIGYNAFYGCGSLGAMIFPGTLTSLDGLRNSGLTSADLSALTITTLSSFQNCTRLKEVKLPATVTSIAYQAFDGCTSLDTLNWGDLTTNTLAVAQYAFRGTAFDSLPFNKFGTLNQDAFANIAQLVTVDLAGYTGTATLPENLFSGCENLAEVKIPQNLTAGFAYNTFPSRVTYEIVPVGGGGYEVFESGNIVVKDHVVLVTTPVLSSPVSLDNSITGIGASAFRNSTNLSSVDLSGCTSLATIGQNAFDSITGLVSVTFPSSLISIGQSAFLKTGLSSADLSGCTAMTSIGNDAFAGAAGLGSVTFPASLTSIGQYAFSGTGLSSANLSGCTGLASIGNYAFRNTTSLTSVTFPASLTSIGQYAFSGSGLASADLSGCTAMTSLGNHAFNGAASLGSVTFPPNLQTIGSSAFSRTASLTSVTFPASLTTIGTGTSSVFSNSGIASADMSACTSMTTITAMAFYNAAALGSVTFPPNLQSIGSSAFSRTGFISVTLPASLTTLGDTVFQNNANLEWVKWPAATNATVGSNAFSGSTKLTHVELPAQMAASNAIDSRAFANTDLQVLVLRSTSVPGLSGENAANAFPDKSFTIYVPDAAKSAYENATGWTLVKSKIAGISTLPMQDEPSNWL